MQSVLLALVLLLSSDAQTAPGLLERCRYPDRPDSTWALPNALREISGLAGLPNRGILAHNDEHGVLYLLDPAGGEVRAVWTLAGRPSGDFEGIAVIDQEAVLLTSDGRLYEASLPPSADGQLPYRVQDTGLGRECEFEGLAYDTAARVLLLPCKSIRRKAGGVALRIFRWDAARGHLASPAVVEVSRRALAHRSPWTRFHASAIEIAPADGHLLILSSIERGLVELGPDGSVIGVKPLRARSHRQPEGLIVTPEGALFISDEGRGHAARLSLYRCHL